MEFNIHAGQRVLYKQNGQWRVGELAQANAFVDKGLFLPVIPEENFYTSMEYTMVEINDIFFDAKPVKDFWKDYSDIFMIKEDYIQMIEEDEEFEKAIEEAYVSDGEYYYYKINKFNRAWLTKQPFDYVVRLN